MNRTALIVLLVSTSCILQPLSALAAEPTTGSSTIDILTQKVSQLESVIKDLKTKLASNRKSLLAAVGQSVPGTDIGKRAQTTTSVSIKGAPLHTAASKGTAPAGTIGTVVGDYTEAYTTYTPAGCGGQASVISSTGCTAKTTYYAWKRMDFDNVVDGWVLANTITAAVSGKYMVGNRMLTSGNDNVRSTPNGTVLGTQAFGSSGTITGSPVASGGYVWWPVDFDTGVDGWVAESNTANQGVPLSLPTPSLATLTAPLSSDPSTRATQLSSIGMTDAQATQILDGLKAQGALPPSSYNPTVMVPQWAKDWTDAGNYVAGFTEDAKGHEVYFAATADGTKLTVETDSNQFGTVWTVKSPISGEVIAFMDAIVGSDGATYVAISRVNDLGQLETLPLERITLTQEDINSILRDVPQPGDYEPIEGADNSVGVVSTVNQGPGTTDSVADGADTISVPNGCTSTACESVDTGSKTLAPMFDFSWSFYPAFGVIFHTKLPH